jgi:ribosomal protein S18 acetylase RimI-like enzyme
MPETYSFTPLDPKRHDRSSFSCGVAQVDNFFQSTANKLSKADNIRVHVLETATGSIIGFYALNAHSVSYSDLPERFAKDRPRHGNIPAVYLSMIGIDRKYQNQGFGGAILAEALARISAAADTIGIKVVLLDILDCGNPDLVERRRALYERYGFLPLPGKALRYFMPLATVRQLLAAG